MYEQSSFTRPTHPSLFAHNYDLHLASTIRMERATLVKSQHFTLSSIFILIPHVSDHFGVGRGRWNDVAHYALEYG
jgi:hypothetical protein